MTSLAELMRMHQRLPFPEHSGDDELDDLLLEMSEYEGYLVGLATSSAHGDKAPAKLASDDGLWERIGAKVAVLNLPDPQKSQIAAYVKSLSALQAAVESNQR